MERTLVLIKPDAVQRDLVGEIIARLERKGLKLIGIKMIALSNDLLDIHYSHLAGRDFFSDIKTFMRRISVIVCFWVGTDCVKFIRLLCCISKARDDETGSI